MLMETSTYRTDVGFLRQMPISGDLKKIQYSDIIPNFCLFSLDTKTQKDFRKICYIYLFICLHTAHCVRPFKQVHCQQGN